MLQMNMEKSLLDINIFLQRQNQSIILYVWVSTFFFRISLKKKKKRILEYFKNRIGTHLQTHNIPFSSPIISF